MHWMEVQIGLVIADLWIYHPVAALGRVLQPRHLDTREFQRQGGSEIRGDASLGAQQTSRQELGTASMLAGPRQHRLSNSPIWRRAKTHESRTGEPTCRVWPDVHPRGDSARCHSALPLKFSARLECLATQPTI
jgi:hypothetical protein